MYSGPYSVPVCFSCSLAARVTHLQSSPTIPHSRLPHQADYILSDILIIYPASSHLILFTTRQRQAQWPLQTLKHRLLYQTMSPIQTRYSRIQM